MGLQQGKYSIVTDENGFKQVRNELDGLQLLSPNGSVNERQGLHRAAARRLRGRHQDRPEHRWQGQGRHQQSHPTQVEEDDHHESRSHSHRRCRPARWGGRTLLGVTGFRIHPDRAPGDADELRSCRRTGSTTDLPLTQRHRSDEFGSAFRRRPHGHRWRRRRPGRTSTPPTSPRTRTTSRARRSFSRRSPSTGRTASSLTATGVNFPIAGVIAFVRSVIDGTDGRTAGRGSRVQRSGLLLVCLDSESDTGPCGADLGRPPGRPHARIRPHASVSITPASPARRWFRSSRTTSASGRWSWMTGRATRRSTPSPPRGQAAFSPGAVDFGATTGTVSGTVVSGYDGSALFGAHVEAFNLAAPTPANEISAISGELTLRNGQGEYTIRGLPPGPIRDRDRPARRNSHHRGGREHRRRVQRARHQFRA